MACCIPKNIYNFLVIVWKRSWAHGACDLVAKMLLILYGVNLRLPLGLAWSAWIPLSKEVHGYLWLMCCMKLRLHIRMMREAWCVFTEIIENRKSDSTCMHVMRDAYSFWARVFTALITRAYHDVILWILPDTSPPQDPCMWSRDNHLKHRPYSKNVALAFIVSPARLTFSS